MDKTKAFEILEAISEDMSRRYFEERSQAWADSPFQWLRILSSRTRGKAGKEMVEKLFRQQEIPIVKSPGSDSDLLVAGKRVGIKFSTLWQGGIYCFEQIRDQDYEILVCLGLSPHSAHAWIAKKSEIVWGDMRNQHGGAEGRDTWWIQFEPPHCPHGWMHPTNGDLSRLIEILPGYFG